MRILVVFSNTSALDCTPAHHGDSCGLLVLSSDLVVTTELGVIIAMSDFLCLSYVDCSENMSSKKSLQGSPLTTRGNYSG